MKGIKIDGQYLSHLRFANDVIIFANVIEEFQNKLHELNQASLEVGLSVNPKNTKVMYSKFTEGIGDPTIIDSSEIEEVIITSTLVNASP